MKKAILSFLILPFFFTVKSQKIGNPDVPVNDTLLTISHGESRVLIFGAKLQDNIHFSLNLYEDIGLYELSYTTLPPAGGSVVIMRVISWGEYYKLANELIFHDNIAGFKMKAFEIGNERITFLKDYFPQIDKVQWISYGYDEEDNHLPPLCGPRFQALFDRNKALQYRKGYNRVNHQMFDIITGSYEHGSLMINENRKWYYIGGYDFALAEGTWRRKGNIIILKCPKLSCNFYMTIEDGRLRSMLLPGDLWGLYFDKDPIDDDQDYPDRRSGTEN